MIFNPKEQAVLRYLERRFIEGDDEPKSLNGSAVLAEQVKKVCGLDEPAYRRIMSRLATVGIAKANYPGSPNEWITIDSQIVDAVHQLDHRPPPDYWKKVEVWFRSKWWSVPVVLIGVGIGWCLGVIAGIKLILQWFGVVK